VEKENAAWVEFVDERDLEELRIGVVQGRQQHRPTFEWGSARIKQFDDLRFLAGSPEPLCDEGGDGLGSLRKTFRHLILCSGRRAIFHHWSFRGFVVRHHECRHAQAERRELAICDRLLRSADLLDQVRSCRRAKQSRRSIFAISRVA